MAKSRISTAFTLLTGAAGGFLVALMLQDSAMQAPPVPAPGDDPVPVRPAVVRQPQVNPRSFGAPDPSAGPTTLAEILQLDGEFEQTAALYELIRQTDAAQLERLISEADTLRSVTDRRGALSILYGRYADLDPEAALGFLLARGASHNQVEVRALFHAWARRDLTAAVEAARDLPLEMRTVAGATILSSRDDLAADAQRDIAGRLGVEDVLANLGMQRVLDEADRDPRAAWRAALAAGGGPMRIQRLAGIVSEWAREDPLTAMEAIMSLQNVGLRVQLQHQVVSQWGRRNAREAVDWVLSQPPSSQRRQLSAAALGALAGDDPRTAFAIADGLEGQERAAAVSRVLTRWAQDDPAAAARSAEAVSGSVVRQGALFGIASAYAHRDPQGALQWIDSLDANESGMAVSVVFNTLAQQNPMDAANLVDTLSDPAVRTQAATSVASAWAQQDPAAAARWAESLVDDEVRRQATSNAVQAWAGYDREAAVSYAGNLMSAQDRDAALVAILQTQHGDTDFGARIFERLTEPEHRAMAARLLYFNLRESDPERAERYRELSGAAEGRAVFGVRQ